MKQAEVRALDGLFSKYVRLLSGGYCRKCGVYKGYQYLDNAHFIGRKKHATRWDIKNVAALCKTCHAKIDDNPFQKYEFFYELLGKEEFEALSRKANIVKPLIDVEAIKDSLKEKIRILEHIGERGV